MAFEAIPLSARGGVREPGVRVHFLTVLLCSIFRFPGGGSAKRFKKLLKHFLFCNCCYAIVVLQLCFAIDVLQLSFCNCRFAILIS